jgi:hypothetical protein
MLLLKRGTQQNESSISVLEELKQTFIKKIELMKNKEKNSILLSRDDQILSKSVLWYIFFWMYLFTLICSISALPTTLFHQHHQKIHPLHKQTTA